MHFSDCNCCFGRPSKAPASPARCDTVDELLAQLNRAGITQALTWHMSQYEVSPQVGNETLAQAIEGHDNLRGVWTLLPPQTGEMPVDALLARMQANNIVALRAFPVAHRFVLNRITLGPLLDAMVARRIPLLYSTRLVGPGGSAHAVWQDLHSLLAEAPELTVIITDHGSWGCDRYFRPLLEQYPRVYVDTSLYFLDGGIESLVETYGPGRILFGSGLPERYAGGMMLAIRHGGLPEPAKAAIASGNLEALLEEVDL